MSQSMQPTRSLAELRRPGAPPPPASRRGESGPVDLDVFHAMAERDNALVADEVLHGSLSAKFVYQFSIQGTQVAGVSVVGARHLAAHYGGIKHRLIGSIEKRGAQFIFTTYPHDTTPMSVTVSAIYEMENDPDFYKVLVEIMDVKRGNTVQAEKMEMRFEKKRDGTFFERPNFQIIAQSKAYRNAVLALVPQDVVQAFQQQCIAQGKSVDITESVIDQKRSGVVRYATQHAIPIDTRALARLNFDQLSGLGDAARHGLDRFRQALDVVGMSAPTAAEPANRQDAPRLAMREVREEPPHDPETGEVKQEGPQSGGAAPQQTATQPPKADPCGQQQAAPKAEAAETARGQRGQSTSGAGGDLLGDPAGGKGKAGGGK